LAAIAIASRRLLSAAGSRITDRPEVGSMRDFSVRQRERNKALRHHNLLARIICKSSNFGINTHLVLKDNSPQGYDPRKEKACPKLWTK
jgi:hypothetical protein